MRLLNRIRKIPHLFAKITVIYCIGFFSASSLYSMRILSRTDKDPSTTLAIIGTFCGGELCFLCLKTILGEKRRKDDNDV